MLEFNPGNTESKRELALSLLPFAPLARLIAYLLGLKWRDLWTQIKLLENMGAAQRGWDK